MSRVIRVTLLLLITAAAACLSGLLVSGASAAEPQCVRWKHFVVCEDLPGSEWGTGGIAVGDFDGDGDPDFALSRREPQTAYWFERKSDAQWVRHTIGVSDKLKKTLGAAALDLDLDGDVDVAFRGVWFRNPGKSASADGNWEAVPYEGGGHDVIAADINGDKIDDLVTYDGHALYWFNPADGLARTTILDGREDHGGVAPKGVADLNGDGCVDVVLPGIWLENPGSDGEWRQRPWPHLPIPKASYGTSMRVWLADLDKDGDRDIIWSDCDTGCSHVYWVENEGKGERWTRHLLPDPPGDSRTGSFHSLAVVDFDGDGTLEIFAGEQEDPDTYMTSKGLLPMKPKGLKERGVIWKNVGVEELQFTPTVIQEDNPGWHDVMAFDVDGDGDIDLISKIWNADGPTYHVDYWRNEGK